MDDDDFGLTIDTSQAPQNDSPGAAAPSQPDLSILSQGAEEQLSLHDTIATSTSSTNMFARLVKTGRILGRGTAGVVELAVDPSTDEQFALKTIKYDGQTNDEQKAVAREIQSISRNTFCPILIRYYGAKSSRALGTVTLAMEYMDLGSLHSVMKLTAPLPPVVLRVVAVKMLVALAHLHSAVSTIHRDVKPKNILLSSSGALKLADFGLAREGVSSEVDQPSTFVGTLVYMAPETFRSQGCSSPSTDIWALGISLCELSVGVHPMLFAAQRKHREHELHRHIFSGKEANAQLQELGFWETYEFARKEKMTLPENNASFSEAMRNFVDAMLQRDPSRRATASQLLSHPWILEAGEDFKFVTSDKGTVDVIISGLTATCYNQWVEVVQRQVANHVEHG